MPKNKEIFSDSGANFSECRNYRYALWRIWDSTKPLVMFIGLNPSTANEAEPDATIRSVIRIARYNGYGGVYMMNCWPFVTSKPELLQHNEYTDKWNDVMLTVIASRCKDVVLAWGNFKVVSAKGRDKELLAMFPRAKVIGLNSNGSPKHPLFQKGESVLIDYNQPGNMETIKIDARAGDNFEYVALKAKQFAAIEKAMAEFDFNGVTCCVTKSTNLAWLLRDYHNSWTMGWKVVGPDCVEKYSAEVQAEFERKSAEQEEKAAKEAEEWRRKERAEAEACRELIKDVKLELSDEKAWKRARQVNSDGYGRAALDYAEAWAKKMQLEIARGGTVAQCYDSAQKGLGFLGITGFQFGAAVSTLAQVWKYGAELRDHHNSLYGIKSDKGTVNPAVFTIGGNKE